MLGVHELLIIAGIMLLLFGGSKVPALMGGLGKGIKEFKKGVLWNKEDDMTPEQLEMAKKAEDKAERED